MYQIFFIVYFIILLSPNEVPEIICFFMVMATLIVYNKVNNITQTILRPQLVAMIVSHIGFWYLYWGVIYL